MKNIEAISMSNWFCASVPKLSGLFSQITLRIRCNIRSVGDINIVDQHFSVKMWFSACWFEPLISPYQDREVRAQGRRGEGAGADPGSG